MLLRARIILPITAPPIEDGAVRVNGNRVAGMGRWRDLAKHEAGPVRDLGEVVLMPGLVNAHCHLDYTDMAGRLAPTKSFPDWIKTITTYKASWDYSEFALSWLNGARMLLRSGTTTVADIEAVPELLPDVREATPLRVFSFLEMTGVKSRRAPETILAETVARIDALPAARGGLGLSPHAPYSTTPALLRLCSHLARKRRWRIVSHVAESETEFEMFRRGRGAMFDWLNRNERDMSDCGFCTPVRHLAQHCLLDSNLLAVHANYLDDGDLPLLANHGVHIVHCPRSHAYFGHRRFPLDELRATGVNLCLGTDSLATTKKPRGRALELNLFTEMRALAAVEPGLDPEMILRMATINGARALGLAGQIGEVSTGALADLIAVPQAGRSDEVAGAMVHFDGCVTGVMIDGQWALTS